MLMVENRHIGVATLFESGGVLVVFSVKPFNGPIRKYVELVRYTVTCVHMNYL